MTKLSNAEIKKILSALNGVDDWWIGKVHNGPSERTLMWAKCKAAADTIRQKLTEAGQ
jgi:hypothetical protein